MTYLRQDIVQPHVLVHHNYNKNYLIVVFVSFGVAATVVGVAAVVDVDDFVVDGGAVQETAEKETEADYSSFGLALK